MGGKSYRVARVALAVVAGLLSVFVSVDQASAHNSLTGSSPANGARLADPPSRIELRFLSRLTTAGTKITVTGPDNVPAAAGPPTVTGTRVEVPFRLGAAGLYIVEYEVVSADGHPVRGEIRFTMTVGSTPRGVPTGASTPTPGVVPGSTPPAPPSQPEFTASPPGAPGTTGAGNSGDNSWWPLLTGLLVVAALVVGVLLRRRVRAR